MMEPATLVSNSLLENILHYPITPRIRIATPLCSLERVLSIKVSDLKARLIVCTLSSRSLLYDPAQARHYLAVLFTNSDSQRYFLLSTR